MRWLLGFAVVATGVLCGLTRPEGLDYRASLTAVSDEILRVDRGEAAQTKPGSAKMPLLAVGIDAGTTAGSHVEDTSPNVRIFGRDGEPVVGCWFQVMVGIYTSAMHTDATGGLVVGLPSILKCGGHLWPVEFDGMEIHAEEFVPLDIEILIPSGVGVPVAARAADRSYRRSGSGQAPIPSHIVWGKTTLRFDVELPDRLARPRRELSETFLLSRYAERARLAIPAWPTTTVRLTVHGEDGKPVRGVKVYSLELGGSDVAARYEPSDAAGAITIRGVPLLRHERLDIDVMGDGTFGRVSFPIGRYVHARVELQDHCPITFRGGCGGTVRGRSGRRRVVRAGSGSYKPATLVLFINRENGAPARAASVQLSTRKKRADRFGQVRFEGLRPGRHSLWVSEPGFVTLHRDVVLNDGETKYLTLHEPSGATKTVRVEDHEGAPVPFARVTVEGGATYARIIRGVQDLALFTDGYGEIELTRLSRGNDRVLAVIGSRSKRIKIQNGPAAVVGLPKPRGMR